MPDLPLVEAVARELHRANNCCCYGWDEEGAKHREPFLRRSREVVTDATAEQAAEVERLERRVDELERDLAVFTKEPGVLARIGHEQVTYWYNQTRLRDADVERLRAALVTASPFIWRPNDPEAYWRSVEDDGRLDHYLYDGHTYRATRDAARIVDKALAATPVASFTSHRDDCPGRFHVRDSAYCDLCNPGWRDTEWGRTYTGPCYPPTPVAPTPAATELCAAYGQDHSRGCPASDTYPLDGEAS